MNTRGSSLNLQRPSSRRPTKAAEAGNVSQASIGKSSNPGGGFMRAPRVNASNNENGDEFFKLHGAVSGFKCCLAGCDACKHQMRMVAVKEYQESMNPVERFI